MTPTSSLESGDAMIDAPELEPAALEAACKEYARFFAHCRAMNLEDTLHHVEQQWSRYIYELSPVIRAYLTAHSAPEAGKAVDARLEEREDDALICVPHWQWGKYAIARRPKAMTNEEWRPIANRIIAALASSTAPAGADVRQIIFDALDLSEELRVECTADVVNALEAAGVSLASPQPVAPTGGIAGLARRLNSIRRAWRTMSPASICDICEESADAIAASEAEAADLRRKLEEARKALAEVRGHFLVDYSQTGGRPAVTYDMDALPKIIALLDRTLSGASL